MAEEREIIIIDGSVLEGGGQILRNAVAYSCLLRKPIKVVNIRAGRSKPGLRPQHLCGVELIRDLCSATLRNAHIGSTEITFTPGSIKAAKYRGDTGTAGSICLLLQTALPCMMFADSTCELLLKGGTNADMAPQYDYLSMVTIPVASKFGLECSNQLIRRGFFPKGGGEITATVDPIKTITPVKMLDRGYIAKIYGLSFVAGTLSLKLADDMADVACKSLVRQYPLPLPIKIERLKIHQQSAVGSGSGIIIVAETSTGCLLAGSSLGDRVKRGEQVGREAADQLLTNISHGGCVDEYTQDQVIILMALASGTSRIRVGPVTLHTETAIHVAGLLTQAKFTIEKIDASTNIINCEGIGLQNELI